MPKRRPNSYLRTRRMRTGLSIPEFAQLTGYTKQTISKYELEQIPPSVRLIMMCELLFGDRYTKVFPAFWEDIEEKLGARALKLSRNLHGKADARSRKVIALLSEMARRRLSDEV